MPPWARSKTPILRGRPPSPSSPNSSRSRRSGVMPAALTARTRPWRDGLAAWISRAEVSLPAPAGPVISTRLLAGADLGDGLAQVLGGRRGARIAVRRGRERAQAAVLALQRRRLQRPLHHQQQAVGLERLLQEVVGAALDGADRGLDVAVAGDHHHRQVAVELLDEVEQLQPVHARRPASRCRGSAARAAARGSPPAPPRRSPAVRTAVALVGEDAGHQLADVGLVVDDQNVTGHTSGVLQHMQARRTRQSGVGNGRGRQPERHLRAGRMRRVGEAQRRRRAPP